MTHVKKKRRVFLSEVCLSVKEVYPLWLLTNTKLFSQEDYLCEYDTSNIIKCLHICQEIYYSQKKTECL